MNKENLQELLEMKTPADQELEKLRTPVTILFSDIKDSTTYFERKGDVDGLAMVERHNSLLSPVIHQSGGRVVKTMGDAIMACFEDPVGAINAAVGMQRALEADRAGQPPEEQIHIRVGLHMGLGLMKDNDVYGDVVNAAARVQRLAQPDQILITDVLLDAAKVAGIQCAKLGKAEMKGKDEPIDVYALGWSAAANAQLLAELQSRYESKLRETKRQFSDLEEEFESSREQWRAERRRLADEIENLEEAAERAREGTRREFVEELQSELRFQLDEAIRERERAVQDLEAARAQWTEERRELKAQILSMQAGLIEAMERSNNPARTAAAVREQVEARLAEARKEWTLQWEGERRRLNAEIDRLKRASGAADEKKEAARRALLQKLGKLPPSSAASLPTSKTADQWEKEFEEAKIQWECERDQLNVKLQRLEQDIQQHRDTLRSDVYQELRSQYEPKLAEAQSERQRIEQELEALTIQYQDERRRLDAQIDLLQQAIPEAQAAARKQAVAELEVDFASKIEDCNRLKGRAERKLQDSVDELEAERLHSRRLIGQLEEQLKEARETAFKAQRRINRDSDL
jgi:class 3 adenylate cyclase